MTDINADSAGEATQQVQLVPFDVKPVQLPSADVRLARRSFNNVLITKNCRFDGSKDTFFGGEFATLLREQFKGMKGVDLAGLEILARSYKDSGGLAICFTSSIDAPSGWDGIETSMNSYVVEFNNNTKGQRYPIIPTFPTGLGTQLVPSDPAHPNLHMYCATKGFKGLLQFYIKVNCDTIIIDGGDFQ